MAKTALVISGGGSKGAFAVGALKYIHENVRPVDQFDVYCGTSTGALIVPLAACGELALLEQQYTTLRQDDLVKLGTIGNLALGTSLHDATPLKNKINELLTDDRFQRLRAAAAPVMLATVCLQTQQLVYWTTQPAPPTAFYDVMQTNNATELRRAMLASSCQPVLMQPVEVIQGAQPVRQYVDGGVREPTPLQAAIDQGAETIIAITLSPRQHPADPAKLTQAVAILERTTDMFGEDVASNDYRLARLYQQGNAYLEAVRTLLLADGVAAATVQAAFAQAANPFGNTAVTTIHEIRPATKLVEGGPGGLTFDPAAMRGMLAKGQAEAKAYFEALPGGAIA
ncbi:MAG TPA: patatin-like phospholipase family protein [Hymenobacter sp.]|jgi:predicted acylesterase/phospholipase RssA|uniref:patatin-like phospholipase family protein n=1 Tax=Hymenobacter sp. TaxID=1898978 RepID=UPI002EDB1FB5